MDKWDFHIHSCHSSDCHTSIFHIFKAARKVGLDGISITDHNNFDSFKEAKSFSRKFGIEYIQGVEVSTEFGDVLGLGISEPFKTRNFIGVIDEIRSQGGVAVAAHPFDPLRKHIGENASKTDAIEINSHAILGNSKARTFAKEKNLPLVGGSDAHSAGEIGACYTLCNEPIKSIKHKKTEAVGGFSWSHVPIAALLHAWSLPGRAKRWIKK